MMEYLVILLDDTAPSYCAYTVPPRERRLISTEALKAGITFALKENLRVQFVCPDYALPPEYRALMETVEHSRIQTADCAERGTEVAVFNGWDNLEGYPYAPETAYILRTGKEEFFRQYPQIAGILERVARLNVIITDIETFGEEDFSRYAAALRILSGSVLTLFLQGKRPQLNLLTDRLMLEEMNNCNAGWKNITLAPDGRFYICPAFYYENEPKCVGSLKTGLHIGDACLYRPDYAPICRRCDAYHCRRCIWQNKKTTLEVNIPSREQCVTTHIEREAARCLLDELHKHGLFANREEIKELSYLDPLDTMD